MRVGVFTVHPRRRVARGSLARLVRGVLRAEGIRAGTVRVILQTDGASRTMNRRYLGHDRVTDVISFLLEKRPAIEGEIYVNLDQARRQADRFRVSFGNEVARLAVHGALHLAGWNDTRAGDRRKMKEREDLALEGWNRGRRTGGRHL